MKNGYAMVRRLKLTPFELRVAGIILLLTLIGYLSVKKMLRGTAADALRPYSPKKMKPTPTPQKPKPAILLMRQTPTKRAPIPRKARAALPAPAQKMRHPR